MGTLKLRNAVLLAALAGALAACGGGGARSAGSSVSGFVSDGYVSGATVVLANADGSCPVATSGNSTTTLSDGSFSFPAGQAVGALCVTGGKDLSTNTTLVGTLKAPAPPVAGAPLLVTPLTTLVAAKMAADGSSASAAATAIANSLNLGGISLLTIDPDLPANAVSYPQLTATTMAVQTLLTQAAQSVASAANNPTPTTTQTSALYNSAVAGLVAAVAASSPVNLTTASTGTLQTLASSTIQNAVTNAQLPANTAATGVSGLAPASVAAVSANTVAGLTQNVATTVVASAPTLAATGGAASLAATINQQVSTLTTYVTQVATLLTQAVSTALGGTTTTAPATITTLGTNVSNLVIPVNGVITGSTTNLQAAAASAVTAAASGVGGASGVAVTAPVISTPAAFVLSSPMVNGVAVTTTSAPYNVAVTGPLTNAAMTVTAFGTPTVPATVSAGFSVTEVGGNHRVLDIYIDKVNVTNTGNVTVPAGAKLYAYGKNSAGIVYSVVLTNAASNVFTSSAGTVTVSWNNVLTALSGQPGFANLSIAKGVFDVAVGLSGNLPLYKLSANTPADGVSVTIPATAAISSGVVFSGTGSSIRVTVN